MFGIDSSELAIIALVALLVIGPKDLPRVMRQVGQWIAKGRAMTRHVRAGFDTMMRESELAEMQAQWAAQNEAIMKATTLPDLGIKGAIPSVDSADWAAPTDHPPAGIPPEQPTPALMAPDAPAAPETPPETPAAKPRRRRVPAATTAVDAAPPAPAAATRRRKPKPTTPATES
jgi:sec-independent protein translocase protein TatB